MRLPLPAIGWLLVFAVLPVSSAHGGQEPAVRPAADRQYLMFQLFTAGPGFTTEPGKQVISKLPEPGFIDGEAKKILDSVGERGDDLHRLGIVVGPLAMDYTDDQLRTLIERTFAVASKYKIAVGFHIDDSKFWMNRRDLWSNPKNVEWLDWNGTPNTGLYLNWGQPWKVAPQACFNSSALINEARRLAGQVIGPAIAEQVAKLRNTGDDAIFAGVIMGSETAIGRDYETHRVLGYCALTNLGFSRNSPPPDPDGALESVVKNWIGTWAESLAAAGIPRDRIYCHITFISRQQYDEQHGSRHGSYSIVVDHSPPAVAFSDNYRPGFTTYAIADKLDDIYAALNAHGNPPWASAEGTNINIETVPPNVPTSGMEAYLAHMFNHGAAMTNVFGWDIGPKENLFRRATESDEAIAAYRKFLRGVRLDETPLAVQSGSSDVSSLQARMHALPGRIQSYRSAGGDMSLLMPRVEELQEDMRGGQLDAMKQELDQVEAIIDAKVGAAPP